METNIYTSCCSAFKNPYLPNQSPDSNRSTFKSIKYSASKKILINAGQVFLVESDESESLVEDKGEGFGLFVEG
jgi:hypothetical protein